MRSSPRRFFGGLRTITFLEFVVVILAGPSIGAPEPAEDAETFFENRIRPVLVESCLKCHGAEKSSSGLRLDSREAVLKGGDLGPAVVPGDPTASLLIEAVAHTDEFLKMPPEGAMLSEEARRDLMRWVEMGAPWPESPTSTPTSTSELPASTHWAFSPVSNPAIPRVENPGWIKTPVDAFLLARLDKAGLAPSPEADRRTVLRRITFDLTGLPPTIDEIDAFVNDDAPGAYERVVERLLASPRYGERWGRHWLDVARYADTKGYVFQEERRYPYAYTYRDYVIRSFNEDKPYDRFIQEQLAADLLPDGDPGRLAALGFLTVGRRFLNKRDDILDDRIDVTTRGFLGLTVACARCHDHKYDPIPAEDYYSLHGIFASSEEPEELPLLDASGAAAGNPDYQRERAGRVQAVSEYLDAKRREFGDELRGKAAEYLAAAVELGLDPRSDRLDAIARERSIRSELVRHVIARSLALRDEPATPDLPLVVLWRDFLKQRDSLTTTGRIQETFDRWRDLAVPAWWSDPDPDPNHAQGLDPFQDPPPDSVVELAARLGRIVTRVASDTSSEATQPLRDWLVSEPSPLAMPTDPNAFRRLLNREDRNTLRELEKKVAQLDVTHPGAPPRAMVLVDRETPAEPYVYLRGNPDRRGPSVPRRFLSVLSQGERPVYDRGSGRLELARAIADPKNPLTARVLVNRVWMHHMGSPLVNTPSDFGRRSEPPTHPELLDWLATAFVERGWSIKSLHRLIVLSSAYRQQSLARADAREIDPENLLYWRQNRRRLEFEPMRDAMLAVTGRLVPVMGGRPVDVTTEPFTARRTVYAFIDRQNLPGVFRTFDLASPDASSPRRYETTVPQQALFLMNSPFLAEQARALGERLEREVPGSTERRVAALYQWLFARQARPEELDRATRFVETHSWEPAPPGSPWQYGYGRLRETPAPIVEFTPFTHGNETAWQAGPSYPDGQLGYLRWQERGGHPGNDADHAVILRWVAPFDGPVAIAGELAHENEKGDGVRARIVTGRGAILGEWTVHQGASATEVPSVDVHAGETLDFLVDCRESPAFDGFRWAPTIQRLGAPAGSADATRWNAASDFQGPPPPRLRPLEQLAQVLLLTNEFLFID